MSDFQFNKISKYYSDQLILDQISFSLETGEKVALLGPNGAGKTTIMKLIMGEEKADSGQIFISSGRSLGYSEQVFSELEERTVFEYVLSSFTEILQMRDQLANLENKISSAPQAQLEDLLLSYGSLQEKYDLENGYSIESKSRQILNGLGFPGQDLDKDFSTLSGGEKRRASLARLLVNEPDILLLDEPTNHLDLSGIEWLENYLAAWPGTVLVISHDSYFLDNFVSRVLEINNKQIRSWPGNFSSYVFLKREQEKADKKAFEKQAKEIKSLEDYIRRYKAGIKSKQARGRQKQLERKELLNDIFQARSIKLSFKEAPHSGKDVLTIKSLNKEIHPGLKIKDFNLELKRGEALAIKGPNGSGKSSLIKTILKESQDSGEIKWGTGLKIAYFDQEHQGLDPEKTLLAELVDNYDINLEGARQILASVLFYKEDMDKKVKSLSGGEKSRLVFAKIVLEEPNFLILDEPTNHLDLDSKEIIIQALLEFDGSIIFISHDRLLLDLLADRSIELGQKTPKVEDEPDNQSKKREDAGEESLPSEKNPQKKKLNPFMRKKKLGELEIAIEALEEKIDQIHQILEKPELVSDFSHYEKYAEEMEEAQNLLDQLLAEWAELEDENGNK